MQNSENCKNYTIKIFDGFSSWELQRFGTYGYVSNSCSGFPSGWIWSVS